jgi:hypothetical protein
VNNHVSNLKMDLTASATDGNYEFSIIRMTGTTRDAMMGMPPDTPIDRMTVGIPKWLMAKEKHIGDMRPK